MILYITEFFLREVVTIDSLIVQDRPPGSTNPGSAVGAIETFDADVGSGRRMDEVDKAVGDTSCSSPINQDVKGI
jgi:hypothetical protein